VRRMAVPGRDDVLDLLHTLANPIRKKS